MRIVVSGTHASGKSTLISDFARRHPEYEVLPDPFELMDESRDAPSAALFAAQLRVAADRLDPAETSADLIAERGPLDFLAYLLALDNLTGSSSSSELLERSTSLTAEALARIDLLVVLPLTAGDAIAVGADEGLALRDEMNDVLLELIDDSVFTGPGLTVVEIVGDRMTRLAELEALVGPRLTAP